MAEPTKPAPTTEAPQVVAASNAPTPSPVDAFARGNRLPLRWPEAVGVLLFVTLADATIYRSYGFAGWAMFFVFAPAYLFLAMPQLAPRRSCWIVGGMLWGLAGRMVWLGSGPLVVLGLLLLVAFTIAAQGRQPYVLEVVLRTCLLIPAGFRGLRGYQYEFDHLVPRISRRASINLVLPLVVLLIFGSLFILANPDLLKSFLKTIERLFNSANRWLMRFDLQEPLFWLAVALLAVGLLRPLRFGTEIVEFTRWALTPATKTRPPQNADYYEAMRNTLIAVIGLFGIYLVYEFCTLWFREFPEGFYYAGYAHEGAAWLTAALALATGVLAAIFQGEVLDDPRLPRLRRLAWIWSAENFLLALMVYNRLFIYIEFNGMTRMRTIGLFGVSAVVVGFMLVVWKIREQRSFVWLLRAQMWTLAITVYLYAITPVDLWVHQYNVHKILQGDLAPSVQISVHPISSEGILALLPLTECDDPVIREGIKALLAERALSTSRQAYLARRQGWSAYQMAEVQMLDALAARREDWAGYLNRKKRQETLQNFRDYAYQWY